jgi:exonuclease SbcC
VEAPKIDKINQLELRKKELQSYAKTAIQEIQREIAEKEHKIHDCEGCFEHIGTKKDLESKMERIELAVEENQKRIQDLTSQVASLKEKLALAEKIQLKDNKCPVCDSKVEKLNPLFQKEHLIQEISDIKEQIISVEKERIVYNEKRIEFSKKLQNARDAETTLRAHSIKDHNDLRKIQDEIKIKKGNRANAAIRHLWEMFDELGDDEGRESWAGELDAEFPEYAASLRRPPGGAPGEGGHDGS